jgi:hypothetical protein
VGTWSRDGSDPMNAMNVYWRTVERGVGTGPVCDECVRRTVNDELRTRDCKDEEDYEFADEAGVPKLLR